jgi:hypothetical protein
MIGKALLLALLQLAHLNHVGRKKVCTYRRVVQGSSAENYYIIQAQCYSKMVCAQASVEYTIGQATEGAHTRV